MSVVVRRLYFYCSAPLFSLKFAALSLIWRLFVRIASCTPIQLGRLAGGMSDSSSTVDWIDHPPYAVVQKIELPSACLDGRRFSALDLAGDAKEMCDVRAGHMHDTAVRAWIKQRWP